MEIASNARAHLRMDVVIPMQYKKISQQEFEQLEGGFSNDFPKEASALSLSLQPFLEGEGREEDINHIDPFVLNALIDINIKLNLIISLFSSGGEENIFNRMPSKVNLSEGGIAFAAQEEIQEGDIIALEMLLPIFPLAIIKALGKAVRVNKLPNGSCTVGTQYLAIKDEDRDKIVHYLFKRQRERLRGKKVSTGKP
jgi:hypothetical protein